MLFKLCLKTVCLLGLGSVMLFSVAGVSPVIAQEVKDQAEPNDYFGWALAAGRFDSGIIFDLAIGVPGEKINGKKEAGAVNVLYGYGNIGLTVKYKDNQFFHQDNLGIPGEKAQAGDHFGASVAVGDFNGDNWEDLAIGAPGEDIKGIKNAGAVYILYGSTDGLHVVGTPVFHQGSGMMDSPQKNDHFGAALAAGDFDGDGCDDLAIGVPGEDFPDGNGKMINNAGQVHILYGTPKTSGNPGGLSLERNKRFRQKNPKNLYIKDNAERGDRFGFSLTAGNFNNDDCDDLAIGVPYEDIESENKVDAGAVNVIYGKSGEGLSPEYNEFWALDNPDLSNKPQDGARFGFSLAAGDFDYNHCDDLAIGAPNMDFAWGMAPTYSGEEAGVVYVLYGNEGSKGLSADNHSYLGQFKSVKGEYPEDKDWFGWALAAGNFSCDPWSTDPNSCDLAIGVPGEDVVNYSGKIIKNAGAVNIMYGKKGVGISEKDNQVWYQGRIIADWAEENDYFGGSLAAGNFDYDPSAVSPFAWDLAIGVPYEDVPYSENVNAGAVSVLYGGRGGLSAYHNQIWHQDMPLTKALSKNSDEYEFNKNIPAKYALLQNYPNPFNPETHISYQLPQASRVTIKIYNLLGREVITLVNENQSAGVFNITWNGKDASGRDVPSGTYFCRMSALSKDAKKRFTAATKLLLLR
ncbi:MAG: T9SS type A sorting domain-containing protein [Calditrichaeota bacterium]|nr:T9SS type A sorting domain-containing protein [Calditrichota bacterium]